MLIRENTALNGVEISFDVKPEPEVLEYLKRLGFRWSNTKHIWYAKKTEEIAKVLSEYQRMREDSGASVPVKMPEPKKAAPRNLNYINGMAVVRKTVTTSQGDIKAIELYFDKKPSSMLLSYIKGLGFRYYPADCKWSARESEERLQKLSEYLRTGVIPNKDLGVQSKKSAEASKSKKEVECKYGLKVGDILSCSFGYTMSLVSFYKVLQIASPTRVVIAKIDKRVISGDYNCAYGAEVVPVPENVVGKPELKQIYLPKGSNCPTIRISDVELLTLWNGKAAYMNTWD